ncbi:TetR/AcrR family transcriptional regulator [Caulobacter sp. S45]|uniref:TetR/AcrR family transcriptional regulator n=1 Tax=Caulobacter sp. S45 TaxID=1641861 RepID=UPI00131E72A2|nr:TetR/AcrR family transcriptional regulator [Caulobacter sp. S45]
MARPRVFDVDKAVETATDLFWRNGYEATSLADLTAAMGITPPSFYYAFSSKYGLFKRVLEHYTTTRLSYAEDALNQPTARDVAEQTLLRLVDLYTDPTRPPGCLIMNNALPCNENSTPLHRELAGSRAARRARLCDRLIRAQTDGDLPADCDPDGLAGLILVVGWGLAFAAQSGATRDDLQRTVATALKAWPS